MKVSQYFWTRLSMKIFQRIRTNFLCENWIRNQLTDRNIDFYERNFRSDFTARHFITPSSPPSLPWKTFKFYDRIELILELIRNGTRLKGKWISQVSNGGGTARPLTSDLASFLSLAAIKIARN